MPYSGLSVHQMHRFAVEVHERNEMQDWHRYIEEVNELRALKDKVIETIPDPYRRVLGNQGVHEGGMHLDQRINELAQFYNRMQFQIAVQAATVSLPDVELAAEQEAFANDGERLFARGTQMHRFGQECAQSIAKCGVAIVRQHPRRGYYTELPTRRFADEPGPGFEHNADVDRRFRGHGDDRDLRSFPFREEFSVFQARRRAYVDQTLLTDLWLKECVPPESFNFMEDVTGEFGLTVERRRRPLGELAKDFGLGPIHDLFGFYDFSRGTRPHRERTAQNFTLDDATTFAEVSVETAEVWADDVGMLFAVEGTVRTATGETVPQRNRRRKIPKEGFLMATWPNQLGRVPYFPRAAGPWPWQSDLDLMVRLTPARNHWATMKYAQARLAIFRRPQAVEPQQADFDDLEPQTIEYEPGQEPSLPGGAEWKANPFEFERNIFIEYQEVVRQHEQSGAIVAKLMGSETAQHTAVGTAEAIEETSMRPFHAAIESIQFAVAEEWEVFFTWLKKHHPTDPVFVHQIKPPAPGKVERSRTVARVLVGKDVVSNNIRARAKPQSLISQVALKNMADEGIQRGSWTYEHTVEEGWIPGVDDANSMLKRVYASRVRAGMAQNSLEATLEEHRQLLQGQLITPQTAGTDEFGQPTGGQQQLITPQGPVNIRNSQVAASTAAGGTPRPVATAEAAGG